MRKLHWKKSEVAAGTMVALFGLFFSLEALGYSLGTPARIGPGYFPLAVGIILLILGLAIAVIEGGLAGRPADRDEPPSAAGRIHWRAIIILPVSILVFGLVVGRFGLAPAVFLAVLVSTLADRQIALARSLAIAAAMALMGVLIFRLGLGLQVQAFTW